MRATYNRYNAGTGRYERVPEPEDLAAGGAGEAPGRAAAPPPARVPPRREPEAGLERLIGALGGGVGRRLGSLDSEDLLLLAVVYLMYRGSGDRQLLIVLAALLFM